MDDQTRNTPVSVGVYSNAKQIAKERTDHGQTTCTDMKDSLSRFPSDDSVSIVSEVRSKAHTKSLTLMVSSSSVVLVGQSSIEQGKNDHCCGQEKLSKEVQAHCRKADSDGIVSYNVEKPMPLIKKQGYLKGPQCERILEKLEILQDNGHFNEHEQLVTSLLQRCANGKEPDLELALKIERGVAFTYQREFRKSKSMFTSVIQSDKNKTCHALNSDILMARAYFLLVADKRRGKRVKLPRLFEYLERSEFLLQNYDSPEDWAELYQKYGHLWMDRMSLIPDDQRNAQARTIVKEKAIDCLKKAISCSQEDPRLRVQAKRQRYTHLSLAALRLDCVSTATRTQAKPIPLTDIKEAEEHLNFVQHNLGDSIPTGTRVLLLKKRSDQFYRQGRLQLAKEKAEEALNLASSNKFNTEIDPLQGRITFLDDKIEKNKLVVSTELEHSSSETCCSE